MQFRYWRSYPAEIAREPERIKPVSLPNANQRPRIAELLMRAGVSLLALSVIILFTGCWWATNLGPSGSPTQGIDAVFPTTQFFAGAMVLFIAFTVSVTGFALLVMSGVIGKRKDGGKGEPPSFWL